MKTTIKLSIFVTILIILYFAIKNHKPPKWAYCKYKITHFTGGNEYGEPYYTDAYVMKSNCLEFYDFHDSDKGVKKIICGNYSIEYNYNCN